MRFDINKIKLLDCTLRDGGYYNNWKFKIELINKYLNVIRKLPIEYVELGFVDLNYSSVLSTSNVNNALLKKLKIPKSLNLGVMINFSDILIRKENVSKTLEKLTDKSFKSKIKFVRLAVHINEINKIKSTVQFFLVQVRG